MARDLRTWDEDCVDELCDIFFSQFLLGNFAVRLPREPFWDVITNTLNARTGKDFRKRQVMRRFMHVRRENCRANGVCYGPRHGWPVVGLDEGAGPSQPPKLLHALMRFRRMWWRVIGTQITYERRDDLTAIS
ncbi:hypothetical protein CMV_010318 [Castanea mollissima]|uniref:Uncharacterized protein n=1 Tax=Castanea mollissima TaxID=60419 RepID=A0A8J4R7E6_9ROSI|nr:hypothetical protein CMV_010318 [Castanea mollissima]